MTTFTIPCPGEHDDPPTIQVEITDVDSQTGAVSWDATGCVHVDTSNDYWREIEAAIDERDDRGDR